MKIFQISKRWAAKAFLAGALTLSLPACELDPLPNPNNPDAELPADVSVGFLQNLLSGSESGMRNRIATYYDDLNVIGREYWRFSSSDPRFTQDLLGGGESKLDNNTFYTTGPYIERYRVVRNLNLLMEAINKCADLTDAQRKHLLGVALTLKAHQYLEILNMQYNNGIRTQIDDPNNLGPFLSRTASEAAIADMLSQAMTNLEGTDTPLRAKLSGGFAGFSSSASFVKFTHALAARVALYRGNYSEALTHLSGSFMDMNGSMKMGPAHFFSTGGGDQTNQLFLPLGGTGENRIAHPSFIADAEAGDLRLSKAVKRSASITLGTSGLTGDYDVWIYNANTAPIHIIRNEELILIYAEASAQVGNTENAVMAINKIRNTAGLADYSGETTKDALINEVLKQRRYSLFGEGHRWLDMRRYNRLNELPKDRDKDDVWLEFPRPASEG